MTDYTQAADALKRMAVQYKNIVAVAEALESLGSITQATDEARAALESARKERDDFVARYTQEIAACRDEMSAMRAVADKAAQDVRDQADGQARAVLTGAEAKAAQIVGDAQAQASALTDRAITDKQAAHARSRHGMAHEWRLVRRSVWPVVGLWAYANH